MAHEDVREIAAPLPASTSSVGIILLVEDSPTDRLLLTEALVKAGQVRGDILSADSLRAARMVLSERDVDLVMLNLSLPDATGLEALRVISTAVPDTPIVVVSGHTDAIVHAAMAEGADEFLGKEDFQPERLVDLILGAAQRRVGTRRTCRVWEDAASILDAVHLPAAALDGKGRIVAVNSEWTRAADARGATGASTGVGVNYLTVCDQAVGPFSDSAREAAAGTRAVLHGEIERFVLEYPCVSDAGEGWWSLRVVPLGDLGGGAITTHLDITDLRRAETRLNRTDDFPGLDESAPIYALLDGEGQLVHVSLATIDLLGLQYRQLIGERLVDQLHPASAPEFTGVLDALRRQPGRREALALSVRDGLGRWCELDVTLTNRLDDPSVQAITIVGADVTAARRNLVVHRLESRLFERLPVPLALLDTHGVLVYINDQAEEVTGYRRDQIVGLAIGDFDLGSMQDDFEASLAAVAADGRWDGEYEVRRADGSITPVRATMEAVHLEDAGFDGVVLVWLDLSERRQLQDELAYQALHDPLTGLPNRRLFIDHLENALARATRSDDEVAVMFLDLDDFDAVNERVGHVEADRILQAVAALISSSLRTGDIVGRFGGDEFVICCEGLTAASAALEIAESVLQVLAVPIRSGAESIKVDGSLGVALAAPGARGDDLIRYAQTSMDVAKATGKGRIELFDDALGAQVRRRHHLAAELDKAREDGSIYTEFQPQHNLSTGELSGFEALARWAHPTQGQVGPCEFIPLAEETGRIVRLGRKILGDSVEALRTWMDAAPDRIVKVSVNVSARQLTDSTFPRMVAETIREACVPPGRVCLEITESALIDEGVAARAMAELKAVGVDLSIDDFGTGYSSLSRLHSFDLDHLKVDRSFVVGMTEQPQDEIIVTLIVGLARALGLDVVAEGIETQEQLDRLVAMGCHHGQGFLFGRAVSAEQVLATVMDVPS